MKDIIFDFDGTIANSLPVVVEVAESLLRVEISKEQIARFQNMTAKQILKEARIPLYKVPGLLVKARPLLQGRMHEVKLFRGLEREIKLLSKDYDLYVVSSNSASIINQFLQNNNLNDYFKKIYGNVGIFSKAQALKKVTKYEGISLDQSIYIGDEVRDIEASKKVGLPIISVTWGYNGQPILESYKPDYLATKVTDLTMIINSISNKS